MSPSKTRRPKFTIATSNSVIATSTSATATSSFACFAAAQLREQQLTTTLFVDTGFGFRASQCVAQECPEPGQLQPSFAARRFGAGARPALGSAGAAHLPATLEAVEWEDSHGRTSGLDLRSSGQ